MAAPIPEPERHSTCYRGEPRPSRWMTTLSAPYGWQARSAPPPARSGSGFQGARDDSQPNGASHTVISSCGEGRFAAGTDFKNPEISLTNRDISVSLSVM
jgi:hypothetical protein